MATKHTPGPWAMHSPTEGNPKTGDGTYCITTDRDGGVLAYIVPKDWHESPANARLMAAAPALLEAAQTIYKLHYDGEYFFITLSGRPKRVAAIKALRAAISEATGMDA